MDLESELGVSESVRDDDDDGQVVAKKPENFGSNDDAVVERNGGYGVDGGRVEEGDKEDKGEVSSSSPHVMKGYGLKRWRRIRRESGGIKDGGGSGDAGKIGKRGLPNTSQQNLRNAVVGGCDDVKQRSEGSVSSTNAAAKSPGLGDDGFYAGVGGGVVFVAGVEDSGNSEDRSSKSSTAAARALGSRHEGTAVGENAWMKNLNGNFSGNIGVPLGQQGKNRTGSSKKARGEQVKIEKENSHSSMESDSRSSNFVYMQGANSVISNGRQSRSANYDGENSDAAQGGELGEELQAGFQKNLAEFEDVSQDYLAAELTWDSKGESSENYGSSADRDPLVESADRDPLVESADRDPLVESVITLQFAQEALEKELEELKKIGKDDILLFSGLVQESGLPSKFVSADSGVHEPSSSSPLQYGESNLLESQIIGLKQNVDYLERKLEEASSMLQTKDAKITELESTLNNNMSQREETYSVELKQVKYQEMETQLESIYKQKIEAEIVYLAISRTIQALRVAAVDQITILEEQKDLASEQAEILNKTSLLKKQAEKLEIYCEEIVETDEILKLQKRVCQYSSCFFIQLVLLCVVLGLFILQLAPHYNGVVPT